MKKNIVSFFQMISCLALVCFIASCAPQQTVKDETAEQLPSLQMPLNLKPIVPKIPPLPAQPPQQKTSEMKQIETIRIETENQEKYVILNFDDADIRTVISAIGSMLNINYVLAPGVTGKVTIQSHKKFPVKDVFQIFQSILEVNGLTAVKDGALYRVVPIDTAKQQPLSVAPGKEIALQVDSSFITQIVPLEFVKASDVSNMLRNLMPRGADLIVYEPTNLLIVTAPPASLVKFMKILETIDLPSLERESTKTFVYYIENSEAKALADMLKSLYIDKKASQKAGYVPPKPASPPAPSTSPAQPKPSSPVIIESTAGELEGEIIIVPYEDINALIIKTNPRSYLSILETLKKLDIPLKQVLIEVLIAEVTLTDNFQFGIEWMLKAPISINGKPVTSLSGFTSDTQPGTISPTIDALGQVAKIVTTPGVGTPFAAIINPARYGAILSAFAGLGKLNVLSNPHILATDNKEAKIEIGDEIPIATGFQQQPSTTTSTTTTSTTSFVAAGQIQYRTTGVILTVTPHISEKNQVKLKISQEISSRGVDVSLAGITSPSFTTRKAQTTGIVMSGHTLVIGGLISEQKNKVREGLPLLSSIPILGYLFGVAKDEVKKTELIVMVTPHVISSQDEADSITKEFQNKVRTIKDRLENIQKDKEKEKKEEEEKEKEKGKEGNKQE